METPCGYAFYFLFMTVDNSQLALKVSCLTCTNSQQKKVVVMAHAHVFYEAIIWLL